MWLMYERWAQGKSLEVEKLVREYLEKFEEGSMSNNVREKKDNKEKKKKEETKKKDETRKKVKMKSFDKEEWMKGGEDDDE